VNERGRAAAAHWFLLTGLALCSAWPPGVPVRWVCRGFAPPVSRKIREIDSMPTLKLSGLLAILIAAAVLALSLAPSPEPDPSWSSLPVVDLSATVAHGSSGA
jgi:hypothetical protein